MHKPLRWLAGEPRCHELRVSDRRQTWRVVYHIAEDAIVARRTPKQVIDRCKRGLRRYEEEF